MFNSKTIAEITQRTPTSEAFAEYASKRERNVRGGVSRLSIIKAQMIKEGYHIVPQDLLAMFRQYHDQGLGELSGDLFKWHISIKQLGNVKEYKQRALPEKRPQKNLVVCFSSDKEASVSFTPNLTKEDIQFICDKMLQECA